MSSKSFNLKVKNGDTEYNFNEKTGKAEWKPVDYVSEPDNLGDALSQFLEWANDGILKNKVTLTVRPAKGKKGAK